MGGIYSFLVMGNHHFEELPVVCDGHFVMHFVDFFRRGVEVFAENDGGDEDS